VSYRIGERPWRSSSQPSTTAIEIPNSTMLSLLLLLRRYVWHNHHATHPLGNVAVAVAIGFKIHQDFQRTLPPHENTTPLMYSNFSITCYSVLKLTCSLAYTASGFWRDITTFMGHFSVDFHSGSVARSRKPIWCMLKMLFRG